MFFRQLFQRIYSLVQKDEERLLRVQSFLIENIFFHFLGRLVALDYFYYLKELMEELRPQSFREFFCLTKPFLDFVYFQNQQSFTDLVLGRFGETYRNYVQQFYQKGDREIETLLRPYFSNLDLNVKKEFFFSLHQIINFQQSQQQETTPQTVSSESNSSKHESLAEEIEIQDSEESEIEDEIYIDDDEELFEMQQEAQFPPYWNKSRKQKKKFFSQLNSKFVEELQKHKISKENKGRIQIQTGNPVVRKFDKNQKVAQIAD